MVLISYINMFLHFEVRHIHSKFCQLHLILSRSVFCKKGILRNFAKLTGKHLCQSLFFNRVAGLQLYKKRLCHRSFPVNFAEFLRTPFLTEHLPRLLLPILICHFNDTNLKWVLTSLNNHSTETRLVQPYGPYLGFWVPLFWYALICTLL